jgi:sugar phosphate isomerase/epimerase
MLPNLGISTSYFAARGFSIYDSVSCAYRLGFRLIELGANHDPERNTPELLKKIRRDFPEVTFTQHCYFPPVLGNFFSNPAEGPSKENLQVIEAIIEAAQVLKTEIISFHSGLNASFSYKGVFKQFAGFKEFAPGKRIAQKEALSGTKDFLKVVLKKAAGLKIRVAIENIVGRPDSPTTLTSFSDFEKFFSSLPQINFLLDFGHAFIVSKNPWQFFSFGPKIIEMHIDDVDKLRFDHRALSKGILDLDRLFSQIRRLPKRPFLVLEHSAQVKEEEILEEIKLVEKYLGTC